MNNFWKARIFSEFLNTIWKGKQFLKCWTIYDKSNILWNLRTFFQKHKREKKNMKNRGKNKQTGKRKKEKKKKKKPVQKPTRRFPKLGKTGWNLPIGLQTGINGTLLMGRPKPIDRWISLCETPTVWRSERQLGNSLVAISTHICSGWFPML